MAETSLHTIQLQDWLRSIRGGNLAARDELVLGICGRMERLARKMLKNFPNVRHEADTGDILNGALMRLMDAIMKMDPVPATTRDFFGLAAEQIRRELLDLARHYSALKRRGPGRPLPLVSGKESGDSLDLPAPSEDDDLERWAALHEAVAKLPTEEREVMGLTFYHGWTQAQIAELLQVSDRTVRRHYRSAVERLYETLGGDFPVP
ncbi:MAG TPA: sigma-70 family RNA polymerase sigma factor [Gemmataceae bacterium]|nr:sigma-70 family RNA polymerase sigma factor [Gemmataceae bacterium]